MDLATGAIGSLLPKLVEVIKEEYKLQTNVKAIVESFSAQLEVVNAALIGLATKPQDQLSDLAKLWASDVKDLSYDMENVVDSLLVRVVGCESNENKKLMVKMKNKIKKGKACHEIGTAIEDIETRLQQVTSRYKLFQDAGLFNRAATMATTSDPLVAALNRNIKDIIGLESARDEIIRKLNEGGHVSKDQLKVLSIVGLGGLGKTTLARVVYDAYTVSEKFGYKAFVSVSQKPDLKKVYKDLIRELDPGYYKSLSGMRDDMGRPQLIQELRKLLSTKRYFIIIDDIWDTIAWEEIRYAFDDSDCGSIVITTTRNVDVSRSCCPFNEGMIHRMKPLSPDDSRNLFYGKIFSSETCPSAFEKVSNDILKKCGGVPLAIITLASSLANYGETRPIDQWYVLRDSIGHGIKKDDNVEAMKRILSFSYYDLPSHLRACLLCLHAFPEDCKISRDRLIRIWLAEDCIIPVYGTSPLEIGDNYFNELIGRSMIQPIGTHIGTRVEACCVHDIMLDLICDLASKENFVTVDFIERETPTVKKFRRLSLQKSMPDAFFTEIGTDRMSGVRSLTVFSPAISQMPPLSGFQVLRVLDMEGCNLQESRHIDLNYVGSLLHLRYLGLRGTKVGNLPVGIGKLRFLQTLDVERTKATALPSSVVLLGRLMCLNLDLCMKMPKGLSNLVCLEQLTGLTISSVDSAEALGHLTRLRELRLNWCLHDQEGRNALFKSLCSLHKLENLEIWRGLMKDWIPSPVLRRFKYCGFFMRLPTWISFSSLPNLSYLELSVMNVQSEDLQILGTLRALRYVCVDVLSCPNQNGEGNRVKSLVLSPDAFPHAIVCLFPRVIVMHPSFEQGAMPMVRRLRFGLQVDDILSRDFDLSIRNLPSLEQVRIDLWNGGAMRNSYSDAVDVLRCVAEDHPMRPTLRADKLNDPRE